MIPHRSGTTFLVARRHISPVNTRGQRNSVGEGGCRAAGHQGPEAVLDGDRYVCREVRGCLWHEDLPEM